MSEKCSICGDLLKATGSEVWTAEDGYSVSLNTYDQLFIIIDVIDKEYYICEKCYKSEEFLKVKGIDVSEVHHDFGVEYRNYFDNENSLLCLMKSYELNKSAQTLCSIAYTYGHIGDHTSEKRYYLEALKVDPLNFIATENLKKIS